MALSGTIYTTVDNGGAVWRLQLEWTATQNSTDNTSKVTAKLYWMSLDSHGAIYTSASKNGEIKIAGSTHAISATAGLDAKQKKLIGSYSKTIAHNSDGTASVTLDGSFSVNLSLTGKYVGTVNLTAKTFTLNTIPRASTMSSSPLFTAGGNRTISISRYSTSFRHEVELYVGSKSSDSWNWIKQVAFSKSETSKSTDFTSAEIEEIFGEMNGSSTKDVRMILQTYKGDDFIGSIYYYGTVTAPSASTISSISPSLSSGSKNVYIDQSITLNVDRDNSKFTHTLKIYSNGELIKTINDVASSTSWTPSDNERNLLYGTTPNANNVKGNVEVYTYYGSQLVRSKTNNTINFYVRDSDPEFGPYFTFKDNDSVIPTITQNDQYIVQNQSNLIVEIPVEARAIEKNGATMKTYVVTVNGKSISQNYSSTDTVTFDIGKVDTKNNTSIVIKAIDSRGNATTSSKTVKIIPYTPPSVQLNIGRSNGFESDTGIGVEGYISPLDIDEQNQNELISISCRFKNTSEPSYGEPTPLSSNGFPSFTVPTFVLSLDNMFSWDIEVTVTDRLGSVVVTKSVPVGRPILYLDADKKSVGIGDFPDGEYQLKLNGKLSFGGTQWLSNSTGETAGFGAIYLNNSDISGTNAVYFNDVSNLNNGEGLMFLKSGATQNSTELTDYDNFLVNNGVGYLNSDKIIHTGMVQIQTGYVNVTPEANKATKLHVSFPEKFPGTPRVIVSANTTIPGYYVSNGSMSDGPWVSGVSASSASATGFDLYVTRTNTTSTGVQWVAIYGGTV